MARRDYIKSLHDALPNTKENKDLKLSYSDQCKALNEKIKPYLPQASIIDKAQTSIAAKRQQNEDKQIKIQTELESIKQDLTKITENISQNQANQKEQEAELAALNEVIQNITAKIETMRSEYEAHKIKYYELYRDTDFLIKEFKQIDPDIEKAKHSLNNGLKQMHREISSVSSFDLEIAEFGYELLEALRVYIAPVMKLNNLNHNTHGINDYRNLFSAAARTDTLEQATTNLLNLLKNLEQQASVWQLTINNGPRYAELTSALAQIPQNILTYGQEGQKLFAELERCYEEKLIRQTNSDIIELGKKLHLEINCLKTITDQLFDLEKIAGKPGQPKVTLQQVVSHILGEPATEVDIESLLGKPPIRTGKNLARVLDIPFWNIP